MVYVSRSSHACLSHRHLHQPLAAYPAHPCARHATPRRVHGLVRLPAPRHHHHPVHRHVLRPDASRSRRHHDLPVPAHVSLGLRLRAPQPHWLAALARPLHEDRIMTTPFWIIVEVSTWHGEPIREYLMDH